MRTKSLYIAVIGALLLLFFGPNHVPGAYAQSAMCDGTIYDEAGYFDSNQRASIESAARGFAAKHGVVKVLAVNNLRGLTQRDDEETINEFVNEFAQTECTNWLNTTGGFKANLIVFATDDDTLWTDIVYGEALYGQFSAGERNEYTNTFISGLEDGDNAGAVTRVLAAMQEDLAPQAGPVTVNEASDFSWVTWVFVLLLVGGGVYGYIRIKRQGKIKEEQREAAQNGALQAFTQANNFLENFVDEEGQNIVDLEEARIKAKLESLVSEEEYQPLLDTLGRAQSAFVQQRDLLTSLGTQSNPNQEGLPIATYSELQEDFEEILIVLQSAKGEIDTVREKVEHLIEVAKKAPAARDDAGRAIAQAQQTIESVQTSGFLTQAADSLLTQAQTEFDNIEAALASRKSLVAFNHASNAMRLAEQAEANASGLKARKEKLELDVQTLNAGVSQAQILIEQTDPALERIVTGFASDSWESIAGNETEAENCVNWIHTGIDSIVELIAPDIQDWDAAEDLVIECNQWLAQVESLMRSITDMEDTLEEAKANAQNEVDLAQADIHKAREYILKFDRDIAESLEEDLKTAANGLNTARDELNEVQPNYPLAVKLARQANNAADKILSEAQNQHEHAVRQRQKAQTELTEGVHAVSKAQNYIEDHPSDVSSATKRLLRQAQLELEHAQEAVKHLNEEDGDPDRVILHADKAEELADEAYNEAKNEVRSANSSWGSSTTTIRYSSRPTTSYRSNSNRSSRPSRSTSRPSTSRSNSWGSSSPSRSRSGGSSRSRSSSGSSRSRGSGSSRRRTSSSSSRSRSSGGSRRRRR